MESLTQSLNQRTLYYCHICHTNREVGKNLNPPGVMDRSDIMVYQQWNEFKRKLETLPLPSKMYSDSARKRLEDGPPDIIKPEEVPYAVLEMMGNNELSPNDAMLIELSKKGCSLVLCESKILHDRQLELLDCKERDGPAILWIMMMRNQFIAQEINQSLLPGEVGVLFLGRLHNVENRMVNYLQSLGIEVIELNESEYAKVGYNELARQL